MARGIATADAVFVVTSHDTSQGPQQQQDTQENKKTDRIALTVTALVSMLVSQKHRNPAIAWGV